jgi:hypothetical protein
VKPVEALQRGSGRDSKGEGPMTKLHLKYVQRFGGSTSVAGDGPGDDLEEMAHAACRSMASTSLMLTT